jgi:hypothetical protein
MTTPPGLHRARIVRDDNQYRRRSGQAKVNGAANRLTTHRRSKSLEK